MTPRGSGTRTRTATVRTRRPARCAWLNGSGPPPTLKLAPIIIKAVEKPMDREQYVKIEDGDVMLLTPRGEMISMSYLLGDKSVEACVGLSRCTTAAQAIGVLEATFGDYGKRVEMEAL